MIEDWLRRLSGWRPTGFTGAGSSAQGIKQEVTGWIRMERKMSGIVAMGVIALVLMVLALARPDTESYQQVFTAMCMGLRTPATLFCYIALGVLLWLVFSKYGNIRLGGDKAKPEYSTFSWLSCLFMAGCGIGIVYYCQEPIIHLHANPYYGQVPGDDEGVSYSLSLYNWTINNWSQFALLGAILGFYHYNCGKDLRLSSILPGKTPLWVRRAVDVVMALAVMAGLTTSLGFGSIQIGEGFRHVLESDVNQYVLMFFMAVIALVYVIAGLQKGIKCLSSITTTLVLLMLVAVVCTAYHHEVSGFLSYIGKGTGLLIANYVSYSDFYDGESTRWLADTFTFNNLWFSCWAAFVAVFMAKISKGRTLRQFVLGAFGFPVLFTIVWFGIFGRVALEYKDMLYPIVSENLPLGLFCFFENITNTGYYVLLSALMMLIICLFFITSSDSAAYVMATLLSRDKFVSSTDKIFWATFQCLVAMALWWCGGFVLIESVAVVMGIVMMALMAAGVFFFLKKLIGVKKVKKVQNGSE